MIRYNLKILDLDNTLVVEIQKVEQKFNKQPKFREQYTYQVYDRVLTVRTDGAGTVISVRFQTNNNNKKCN
jgi:hypothetical protein